MNIIEMFQAIGAENTCLQLLSESLTNATSRNKTRDCLVTFATNQMTPNDVIGGSGKVGLVVWVERGAWEKMVRAAKSPKDAQPVKSIMAQSLAEAVAQVADKMESAGSLTESAQIEANELLPALERWRKEK